MATQTLSPGQTANFGNNIIKGSLTLTGVGTGYSVAIGGMPAIVGTAKPDVPVILPINNQAVSVSNTTASTRDFPLRLTY